MFQFQTGSIRRLLEEHLDLSTVCFNSKLVRLEAVPSIVSFSPNATFQFQTGAIRSPLDAIHEKYKGFNSKLVRLEVC